MSKYQVDPRDPLPRYYQVYLSLQSRIRAGEFGPGDALPAERLLTTEYGVSRITIIKAKDLLEHDNLIEHHQGRGSFVVDRADAACDSPQCRVLFFLPSLADSYTAEILIGAARVALRDNIRLEIAGLQELSDEPARVRDAIDGGADGLLLLPRARYPDKDLLQELHQRAYPLVLLDRFYAGLDTDRVIFDDEEAGYALTKLLIEKGHRRISVFTGHEVEATSVRGRIRGYRRALREAGIAYDEDLICLDVYSELGPDSLYNQALTHLELLEWWRSGRFTATIAINRYVALQMSMDLMRIRSHLAQATPDESVATGADGLSIEIAAISNKPFAHEETSLVALALQPGDRLGERAMELVTRRMREGTELPTQQIVVPMQIVDVDAGRARPPANPTV